MKANASWTKARTVVRALLKSLGLAGLAALFLLAFLPPAEATLKYKKDTGKKCMFCHTGIPQPGDEDPQLNPDGKKFRDNGYRLTEEQKRKPDPAG